MEGATCLGKISGSAPPITRQCAQRPEQGKDQKQLAQGNARTPSTKRAQRGNECGRRHSCRPHNCLCHRLSLLHRSLLRLHPKEWEMLEHPPDSGGVAFRIAGSSDGIEGEANAKKPTDRPVRDAVAAKVEEVPSGDQGNEGSRLRES